MNWTPKQDFTKFHLIHTLVSNLGSTYALRSKSQLGSGFLIVEFLVAELFLFFLGFFFTYAGWIDCACTKDNIFFVLSVFSESFSNAFRQFRGQSMQNVFLGFIILLLWNIREHLKRTCRVPRQMTRNSFHQVTGARQYSLVKKKGVVKWEVSLSKDIVHYKVSLPKLQSNWRIVVIKMNIICCDQSAIGFVQW